MAGTKRAATRKGIDLKERRGLGDKVSGWFARKRQEGRIHPNRRRSSRHDHHGTTVFKSPSRASLTGSWWRISRKPQLLEFKLGEAAAEDAKGRAGSI
jgi:hypothetical protein